jgi:pantothenate kinase
MNLTKSRLFAHLKGMSMDINELSMIISGKALNADRVIIAMAGPPASGKSYLADKVAQHINSLSENTERAIVVPMDGFHHDNAKLIAMDRLHRKGAPDTFDAEGFVRSISDLKNAQIDHFMPSFDRQNDCVVKNSIKIKPKNKIIIVEGNYLLLGASPWNGLQEIFDYKILLSPAKDVLRERLYERWKTHGLDPTSAKKRAEENDMKNAIFVLENSVGADAQINSA